MPCAADDERPGGGLRIEQLHLPGPSIGEATLVTSPDGTTLLIDVGNDGHRDVVPDDVDLVLVTHDDEDHRGGLEEVAFGELIDDLGTWDLGGEATLEVWLADGRLAVEGDVVELRDEVPDLDDDGDNPRSLGGTVAYGDFVYVFAGDLTGGGKGTPDVESAVAARGDELIAPGSADVVHLNHHGIRSSTNEVWVGLAALGGRPAPKRPRRRQPDLPRGAPRGRPRPPGAAPGRGPRPRLGGRLPRPRPRRPRGSPGDRGRRHRTGGDELRLVRGGLRRGAVTITSRSLRWCPARRQTGCLDRK